MYTQEKAWGIRLVVKAIDSRYVCSCTCIYIYAVHGNVGSTGPWNYESIQCPVKLSSTCPYKKISGAWAWSDCCTVAVLAVTLKWGGVSLTSMLRLRTSWLMSSLMPRWPWTPREWRCMPVLSYLSPTWVGPLIPELNLHENWNGWYFMVDHSVLLKHNSKEK